MDILYPGPARVHKALLELSLVEPEIIHPDEREFTSDTTTVPFRWICRLEVNYGSSVLVSTGTLISPRHVLTAGHVLTRFNKKTKKIVTAKSIRVLPGYNCAAAVRAPFGSTTAAGWKVHPTWKAGVAKAKGPTPADRQFDYGLITLKAPIGDRRFAVLGNKPLGYWGSRANGSGTRIHPKTPASLTRLPVNLSGYPFDKCCKSPAKSVKKCAAHMRSGAQFRSYSKITNPAPAAFPRLIFYDLDTKGGHSGAPVWLRWKQFRNLVAVHSGPAWPIDATLKGKANRGVRITSEVLANLRAWMK